MAALRSSVIDTLHLGPQRKQITVVRVLTWYFNTKSIITFNHMDQKLHYHTNYILFPRSLSSYPMWMSFLGSTVSRAVMRCGNSTCTPCRSTLKRSAEFSNMLQRTWPVQDWKQQPINKSFLWNYSQSAHICPPHHISPHCSYSSPTPSDIHQTNSTKKWL